MNSKDQPLCFQPSIDLLTKGPLWPSVDHATFVGVNTEIHSFLAVLGIDAGTRMHKVDELRSDIEHAVLRADRPGVLLTFDGNDLRLNISTDDDKLAEIEMRAADDGHSSFGIYPHIVRAWVEEGGRYAKQPH